MGNLYGRLFKKEEIRILIQGLDAAGKTTALYQLKLGESVTTIPTIGFNVETVEYMNINITMWDIGGRDKIRPLLRHYYPNTKAMVYIVDSDDREECRIEQARDELHRAMSEDELRDTVLVVLANKQDKPNAMSVIQVSEAMELHKLGPRRIWNIFPTVATTGDGLYEALDWMLDACNCRTKQKQKQIKDKTSDITADTAEPEAETTTQELTNSSSASYMDKVYDIFKKIFLAQV